MDVPNKEQMKEAYDEAELSDDEFEEQSFDNSLDRVESNDASLTKLKVRLSTLVQINDGHQRRLVDRLSTAIGRNAHLKAVEFDGHDERINEAQAVNLFRGIACSRSIKRIHIYRCGEHFGNACRILTPLFNNNQVERMIIHFCYLSIESTRLLATSLAEFDSLKEFALTRDDGIQDDHDNQQAARDLLKALSCHSCLRKLDLSCTVVGNHGCSTLMNLLSNPNISLKVLDLSSTSLGDAEAIALSSGMADNTTLKEIDLAANWSITEVGWQALFDALSSSGCRLEKLTLECNEINDSAAQSLSNALTSNTTLKTLNLGFNRSITIAGWRVLFQAIRSPNCVLEDVNLSDNRLNNEVMTSLADVLASNMSLRILDLSENMRVTGAGWQRFFSTVLANLNSGLEKLDIGYCDINNAAIGALTNALVNNSNLKVLTLNGNDLITNAGWEMFSSVLESPNTALEELYLRGCVIDDATLTSLVNSLAGNKKLKKLIFNHSDDWEPPLSVLCNADSILDTYNSNHILEKLGHKDELPVEFESLLQINRENSPNQAARLKIIKTNFNAGFNTQPFVGMDLNVLPYAIVWMGRDDRAGEVNGYYFSFIKSISSLFENAN